MIIYRDQSGIHTALKNQLHQKYSPEFWTGVVQLGTGIAKISLLYMYAHLYANYGQVYKGDLEEARLGITAQFEFATLSMEQYLSKVRKFQQLHGNALPPRPIIDTEAMGISYINIQKSGLYLLDCSIQLGTGIAKISLLYMYAHLYANYGQVYKGDLEEARLGITAQFEFATLSMEQYLSKVRKFQQLHGNALPPRPIIDTEAMGIAYINIQKSGLYLLDCRKW